MKPVRYFSGIFLATLAGVNLCPEFARAVTVAPEIPACIITPDGGYYKGSAEYSIANRTWGATVHYTTDGTSPTSSSPTFKAGAVETLRGGSGKTTVRAIAIDAAGHQSPVTSCTFQYGKIASTAMPQLSPDGGNSIGPTNVILSSATVGAKIYYTTDGSIPTQASRHYDGKPILLGSTKPVKTTILRAIAVKSGKAASGVAWGEFTTGYFQTAAPPVLSPGTGAFKGWTTVTATTSTPNAVLRYTTDGTIPTAMSTQYAGPKFIGKTTLLRVRAFLDDMADSPTTSATYTADDAVPLEFNAASYGASPDNTPEKNTSAFNDALNAAQNAAGAKARRVRVLFPTGDYRFSSGFIVTNTNNLVIDGQGSNFIFMEGSGTPFNVGPTGTTPSCNNLTFENMSIAIRPMPLVSGYVTSVGDGTFDMWLDPGQTATARTDGFGLIQYDPTTGGTSRNGLDLYENWTSSVVGYREMRIQMAGQSVTPGMYVCLREKSHGAAAFIIVGCDGITLRNIQIYGSQSIVINTSQCSDQTYDRVSIIPDPATSYPMSGWADGLHLTVNKGFLVMQDCTIEAQGDDGVNVNGPFSAILSSKDNKVTLRDTAFAVGDVFDLRDGKTMLSQGHAVVTAVDYPSPQTSPASETVTLSASPPIKEGDFAADPTRCPITSIKRCTFGNNRGRGVLLQCPNVVVENCHFHYSMGAAILLGAANWDAWGEGIGVTHAMILNNSIDSCNSGAAWEVTQGAISTEGVNSMGGKDYLSAPGLFRHLTISDNTLRNIDNGGISVWGAEDVDINNNTLVNCALKPVATLIDGQHAIATANDSDVRIFGNTRVKSVEAAQPPDQARDINSPGAPIYIDLKTSSKISLSDNTGF